MEGSRASHPPAGAPRPGRVPWTGLLAVVLVIAMLPGLGTSAGSPDVPFETPELDLASEHLAGTLDSTFDEDGIAITEIASLVDVRDMDLQMHPEDGPRLLVLQAEGFTEEVWRFTLDGTLDTSFGDNGVVNLPLPFGFVPRRLAVAPDGTFAVGGDGRFSFHDAFQVARFTADGGLDEGFGDDGSTSVVEFTEPGPGACETLDRTFTGFADIGIQSDGGIVVVGPADVDVDLGNTACTTETRAGYAAARLNADGSLNGVRGGTHCESTPILVDPRRLTIASDGTLFVSLAFQCSAVIDPVTVVRFGPDLDAHEVFESSPVQPTDDRRLPISLLEDGHVAVAAEGPRDEGAAWTLLRWNDAGEFVDSATHTFSPSATGTTIGDLAVTTDGIVAVGQVAVATPVDQPDSLAIARFGTDGTATGVPDVIEHPGPPETATSGLEAVAVDGGMRLAGHADPVVFGLDDLRQVMLASLGADGTFDGAYGPQGTGFSQHGGRNTDTGQSVAALPDGRIIAGGRLSGLAVDDPTGFVLRHGEDGPLDPSFADEGLPGIEITHYLAPPPAPPPAVFSVGVVAAATRDAHGLMPLAQAGTTTEVGTEAELAATFADPDETHITLTADISLSDCGDSPDGLVRDSTMDLVVDGAGHDVTQTCPGERLFTGLSTGTLTFRDVTLSGGNPEATAPDEASGGAISNEGQVVVVNSVLHDNVAEEGGGAVRSASGIEVAGTTFEDNQAARGGALRSEAGQITVRDGSTFTTNDAGSVGGAVEATGDVVVTDSTFTGNTAGTNGGAIFAASASPLDERVSATITGSTFDGNSNTGGDGGAVRVAGDVTIEASTFMSNHGLIGGAVYADSVVATSTTFDDNTSETSGGALRLVSGADITGSTFTGNTATSLGGAIYSVAAIAPWTVSDSTFIDNESLQAAGGAIAAEGSGVLTVRGTRFTDNTAGEDGGAIWTALADVDVEIGSAFVGNTTALDGGAIHAAGAVTMTGATFTENHAGDSQGDGGAVSATRVDVDGSTFSSNSAFGDGGAVVVAEDATVTNATFDGNVADVQGAALHVGTTLGLTYATIIDGTGSSQVEAASLISFGSVLERPAAEGDNCSPDTEVSSSSFSYSTDGSCAFTGEGDTINGDATELEPLGDNGGPTATRLPPASSPLVNDVPADACAAQGVTIDQRQVTRPQGLACDIGAVEVFGPAVDIPVEGLAVDSEGRYVIVGSTGSPAVGIIHRVLPGGGPDPAFNGGLPLILDLGDRTQLHDVTVDDQDRIVAVGESDGEGGDFVEEVLVARLQPDGTPDPDFGTGPDEGIVRIAPPPETTSFWTADGQAVTLDGTGRILLTGESPMSPDGPDGLLLARLLPDGSRDGTFGDDGVLGEGVRLGPPGHEGGDVVTRGDAILVAGTRSVLETADVDGFVAQFRTDGTPDPALAGTGTAFPFAASSSGDSVATGLAIDAVGNIVVTGGAVDVEIVEGISTTPIDVLVARLLSNGELDPSFGTGGLVTTDVGTTTTSGAATQEQGSDLAIDGDGRIVVTGGVSDERGSRVFTARYNPGVTTLTCDPDPLDVGDVDVGTSVTTTLTCTSTGGTAVITNVDLDPNSAHPDDYSIDPGTCQDALLFPDEACTLEVTFTPQVDGDRTGAVAISHRTVTDTPVTTVPVQGRGTGEGGFSATPDPLTFTGLYGITSPERAVTVTNVGNLPFRISDVSVVGEDVDDFAIAGTTCDGTTLAPGDSCTVELVFLSLPGPGLLRTAQLRFIDDASGSPHVVGLEGSIAGPSIELDPTEGPIETEVEASGIAFEPGTAVQLRIDDVVLGTVPGDEVTSTTSEGGTFTTTFILPEGIPGGEQIVEACQGCDSPDVVTATAPFEVTARLFVLPSISRPGGVVTADGDGFPAGAPVTLTWSPGLGIATVVADESGEFSTPVLVFRKDQLGLRDLQATISGAEDVAATTPFLAVPGSAQPNNFAVRR